MLECGAAELRSTQSTLRSLVADFHVQPNSSGCHDTASDPRWSHSSRPRHPFLCRWVSEQLIGLSGIASGLTIVACGSVATLLRELAAGRSIASSAAFHVRVNSSISMSV